jgi:hypothetical protein
MADTQIWVLLAWKKIAINTPEDVRLAKDTDRLKTCQLQNSIQSLNLGHSEVGQLIKLEKYILLRGIHS